MGDPQKLTVAASAMMARPRLAAMRDVRTGCLNKGIASRVENDGATVLPTGIKPLDASAVARVKIA